VINATQSFRMNLVRLWLGAACIHGLLFALVVGVVILLGREVNWVAVAAVTLVPAIFWVVYGLRFRLAVTPQGLHWVTLDGVEAFARWTEIVGATRRWLPGLPQVRIELGARGSSWVPLCLANLAAFIDVLRARLGPDHPLTRAVTGAE
jgi:hypothetical protein